MLPPVESLLMASAPLQALISGRSYRHGFAPQDVLRPYVTWSVPGGFAENALERVDADVFRLQVDCWADSDQSIENVASATRAAIEKAANLTAYIADERNPDTGRYRIGMVFDFIQPR